AGDTRSLRYLTRARRMPVAGTHVAFTHTSAWEVVRDSHQGYDRRCVRNGSRSPALADRRARAAAWRPGSRSISRGRGRLLQPMVLWPVVRLSVLGVSAVLLRRALRAVWVSPAPGRAAPDGGVPRRLLRRD